GGARLPQGRVVLRPARGARRPGPDPGRADPADGGRARDRGLAEDRAPRAGGAPERELDAVRPLRAALAGLPRVLRPAARRAEGGQPVPARTARGGGREGEPEGARRPAPFERPADGPRRADPVTGRGRPADPPRRGVDARRGGRGAAG